MLSVFVKPMPFSLTLHVYVPFYLYLIIPIWLSLPCLCFSTFFMCHSFYCICHVLSHLCLYLSISRALSIHCYGSFYSFLCCFISLYSLFLSLSQSLSIPFYASFYPCLCPCISFCLCHDLSLNMSTFFLSLQFHSFCSCRFLSLFMYLFMSIMSLFHLSITLFSLSLPFCALFSCN